jgi:hypothetical protein
VDAGGFTGVDLGCGRLVRRDESAGNLDLPGGRFRFEGLIAARNDMAAWSTLLAWVKILTPKLMLAICTLSAVLLFSSPVFIARLGLTSFKTTNLQWIGLAFLASGSLLVGHGAFDFLPKGIESVRFRIRRKGRARSLSMVEKQVMQSYIRNNTRTQRFNIDSGIISGLVAYGVLHLASKQGDAVSGFPFNITDWAYRYFGTHPELIATPGMDPWNPSDGVP